MLKVCSKLGAVFRRRPKLAQIVFIFCLFSGTSCYENGLVLRDLVCIVSSR